MLVWQKHEAQLQHQRHRQRIENMKPVLQTQIKRDKDGLAPSMFAVNAKKAFAEAERAFELARVHQIQQRRLNEIKSVVSTTLEPAVWKTRQTRMHNFLGSRHHALEGVEHENHLFLNRLRHTSPSVGSRQEWRRHDLETGILRNRLIGNRRKVRGEKMSRPSTSLQATLPSMPVAPNHTSVLNRTTPPPQQQQQPFDSLPALVPNRRY